jgi:hypothetical protein
MIQDRFLRGILIAIAVLAVLAVALFFLRQKNQDYGAENTPDGVVRNFSLALQKGDYQRAYGYLATQGKPDFSSFHLDLVNQHSQFADAAVEISSSQVEGNDATVALIIVTSSSGLFSDISRQPQNASLIKEGQDWKISQMAYPYWSYNWYQIPAKPVSTP